MRKPKRIHGQVELLAEYADGTCSQERFNSHLAADRAIESYQADGIVPEMRAWEIRKA